MTEQQLQIQCRKEPHHPRHQQTQGGQVGAEGESRDAGLGRRVHGREGKRPGRWNAKDIVLLDLRGMEHRTLNVER